MNSENIIPELLHLIKKFMSLELPSLRSIMKWWQQKVNMNLTVTYHSRVYILLLFLRLLLRM